MRLYNSETNGRGTKIKADLLRGADSLMLNASGLETESSVALEFRAFASYLAHLSDVLVRLASPHLAGVAKGPALGVRLSGVSISCSGTGVNGSSPVSSWLPRTRCHATTLFQHCQTASLFKESLEIGI